MNDNEIEVYIQERLFDIFVELYEDELIPDGVFLRNFYDLHHDFYLSDFKRIMNNTHIYYRCKNAFKIKEYFQMCESFNIQFNAILLFTYDISNDILTEIRHNDEFRNLKL